MAEFHSDDHVCVFREEGFRLSGWEYDVQIITNLRTKINFEGHRTVVREGGAGRLQLWSSGIYHI